MTSARTVSGGAPAAGEAAEALFRETIALFYRLAAAAEQVHPQGALSGARRGVLRGLARHGAQTVPQMARARPVSRQHVQLLVNALAAEGFVVFEDNPAHRRSRLVRLTSRGRRLVEAMNRREASLLAKLPLGALGRDIERAANVLRKIREAFESEHWHRLVRAGATRRPARS
ncbi:MAG: MarR family winged helix-turn-helix transcriptional regulator [Thermoanaerobaculia bacterium]